MLERIHPVPDFDMPDFADSDNVLQALECVSFGEPGFGTMSPGSGNVLAMSDFAVDIDVELGGPSLPSGVHLDMPDLADVDNVSQAPECASFGEPETRTMSPRSGNVLAMSDFAGGIDVELGELSLPSGVHLDTTDFADSDNVLQALECASFGEPGSGTISPESGIVLAMSDFAGDIDAEPGALTLPSGVHLDTPDVADIDNVLQAPECASFGEPGCGTISPGSWNVLAMSDFAVEIDVELGEPSLPSGVHSRHPRLR